MDAASSRFFSWWREELRELVPSPLRRWAAGEARRTIFALENGQFVHYEEARGRLVRRGETSLPAGGAGPNRPRVGARRRGPPGGGRAPRRPRPGRPPEMPAAPRPAVRKNAQPLLRAASRVHPP